MHRATEQDLTTIACKAVSNSRPYDFGIRFNGNFAASCMGDSCFSIIVKMDKVYYGDSPLTRVIILLTGHNFDCVRQGAGKLEPMLKIFGAVVDDPIGFAPE